MRTSKTRPAGPLSWSIDPAAADGALVEHDDVVAGVLDVGQQVRGEDEIDALVVREVADELEHLVASLGVHAVGRLVEKQQIGIVDERLRQLDALLHARRVRLDVAVPRLAQADVVEHLVRALHRVGARQAGQLAAVGDEAHRVHAGDVSVALRHVAEPRAHLERPLGDVQARAPRAVPAFGGMNPSSALSIVLLPAPFGPSRPTAPAGKRRGDVAQGGVLAVHDADVIEDDGRVRHQGLSSYGLRNDIRSQAGPGSRALQPQLVGALAQERDHVGDVLIERQANLLGALPQILARHGARERFVLHPLDHRRGLEIEDALRRPDERGGGDEARQLVAGEQRLLQPAFARDAAVVGVRQDRARHPLRIAERRQNLDATVRMILAVGILLVVEVVHERDEAPLVLVLAPHAARSRAPPPRPPAGACAGSRSATCSVTSAQARSRDSIVGHRFQWRGARLRQGFGSSPKRSRRRPTPTPRASAIGRRWVTSLSRPRTHRHGTGDDVPALPTSLYGSSAAGSARTASATSAASRERAADAPRHR